MIRAYSGAEVKLDRFLSILGSYVGRETFPPVISIEHCREDVPAYKEESPP